jgi:hypothetical protein
MSKSRPYMMFREAVLDLSDAPTPVNVQRYLAASRLLDRSARVESRPRKSGRSVRRTVAIPVSPGPER